MKKVIVLLLLVISSFTFAQEKEENKSNSSTIEFSNRENLLIRKDFYEIGKIAHVKFQNIILNDVINGGKVGALLLENSYTSSVTTFKGTLDFEEIEDCIKSLKYIKEQISSVPKIYTEYIYKTKDGVNIGAYTVEVYNVNRRFVLFIQTNKYISNSKETFNSNKIDELINLFQISFDQLKTELGI